LKDKDDKIPDFV